MTDAVVHPRHLAKARYEKMLAEMRRLQEEDDPENHGRADSILCELLIALGFEDIVVAYRSWEKWYE